MNDSPLEEDEPSSDDKEIDDYANLDDFDDGAVSVSNSASLPVDEDAEVHMPQELNLNVAIDVENVMEKFDNLAKKASVDVASVHEDVISLRLPFYPFLKNGHQLAWKEYENSHIVVDLKIDAREYRHAKNLPLVTVVLSTGTTSPPLQLFLDHLRTIAQNYLREHYKDRQKNVLSGLFEELLKRIDTLSNFCCFCDKRLGDEGAFFPTFCSSPLCSFHGKEYLGAHPSDLEGSHVFSSVLQETGLFFSLNSKEQNLILCESPDQVVDFEKRCRIKGVRFLYYSYPPDYWINLFRLPEEQESIRLSKMISRHDVDTVLCEVVDDPTTLIQLTSNDFVVLDIRNVRFRASFKDCGTAMRLTVEDELRLRNVLAVLQDRRVPDFFPSVKEGFVLSELPNDLLLRILQLASRRDVFRLRRASRKFYSFVQAHKDKLRGFRDIAIKIRRFAADQGKNIWRIRLENLLEKRLIEVLIPIPQVNKQKETGAAEEEVEQEEEAQQEAQAVDMDVERAQEEKPIFDFYTVMGGADKEWRAITIYVAENHSLTDVIAKLAEMIEITRVELSQVPRVTFANLLGVLPALRELRIDDCADDDRAVITEQSFFGLLPPNLVSLSFPREFFLQLPRDLFSDPRVQNLQQLHVYGRNRLPDEIFQGLKVQRLCLEKCEVTLEALQVVINEWRAGEREIEAMMVEVVETFQQAGPLVVVARPQIHPPPPPAPQQPRPVVHMPPRQFPGQFAAPPRPLLTQDQIFQALNVNDATWRIFRGSGNITLAVELVPETGYERHEGVCIQLIARSF